MVQREAGQGVGPMVGRPDVVALTEAGDALLDRAARVHALAVHEVLTGRFTDEEQAALLRPLGWIDG